ncbi:exopolysaccharide biosynthesis protein [Altericroceibacterium endophyticum]|uniref:exopolysaccharide biosynthesis protein n=1 Tax=Altericroceibacterium endophyticum TaxID=1808508 RepID=UPI001F211A8C|nr:exopolysaccharide biosynthesis protein [Altericroceibacterium endophyticum]
MKQSPQNVCDILDCLDDLAEEQDEVSVDRVIHAFGSRSYGPCLIVPALLELTPIGAIPGVPTFLAITIAICAVQIVMGRRHLWLPGLIGNRGISAEKLKQGAEKLRRPARWLDRWFHGRLKALTTGMFTRIAAAIVLLLCCTVPPLELLPFASSGPMLAIAAFGLALLVRDGALMLVALALSAGALGLGAYIGLWASEGGA